MFTRLSIATIFFVALSNGLVSAEDVETLSAETTNSVGEEAAVDPSSNSKSSGGTLSESDYLHSTTASDKSEGYEDTDTSSIFNLSDDELFSTASSDSLLKSGSVDPKPLEEELSSTDSSDLLSSSMNGSGTFRISDVDDDQLSGASADSLSSNWDTLSTKSSDDLNGSGSIDSKSPKEELSSTDSSDLLLSPSEDSIETFDASGSSWERPFSITPSDSLSSSLDTTASYESLNLGDDKTSTASSVDTKKSGSAGSKSSTAKSNSRPRPHFNNFSSQYVSKEKRKEKVDQANRRAEARKAAAEEELQRVRARRAKSKK